MRTTLLSFAAAAMLSAPAAGQSMAGMQMPAPTPQPSASPPRKAKPLAAPRKTLVPPHHHPTRATDDNSSQPRSAAPSAMDSMPGMSADQPHAGDGAQGMHDMPGMAPMAAGTDLPAGNAPPPPAQHDRSADRFYGVTAMAEAEARMMGAHGGATYHQILFNLAEYQARQGRNGYRWSSEAWMGGDLNRLVIKSEGEGAFHGRLDSGDLQALYSRAIDPYWNLQAGVRQSVGYGPDRPYAVLSIEGLAPYWLEIEGSLFLSSKGDLLGRAEAYYDQRLTQRLILQPRAELNFAAQDVRENRIGSGLSDVELGLRLRYEIRREFAPYVGVSWERRVGGTARHARAAGEDADSSSLVAGIRFWF